MGDADYLISTAHVDWPTVMGLGISALVALLLHFVAFWILFRVLRRPEGEDNLLLRAVYQPSRWLLVLLVLMAGMQTIRLGPKVENGWTIISAMLLAALCGWLALSILHATRKMVEAQTDLTVEDNLFARRRTTRVRILNRIAQVTIVFLTVAFMLLAIPSVRAVGVTLVASAGLAALAVGAAAQPALKNLIAGIQMAFTEPIRLDDVVIVEGEWGRIEDIRLTYVVVHIWDDRRLIVPVSYFLEKPFQNWTRQTSHLLGAVYFHVDPATHVEPIRAKLMELVEANPKWDRRYAGLQVTEVRPEAMELRALMTARDAGTAFDLRCDVREAIMAFLRDEMPQALPRGRMAMAGDDSGSPLFVRGREADNAGQGAG